MRHIAKCVVIAVVVLVFAGQAFAQVGEMRLDDFGVTLQDGLVVNESGTGWLNPDTGSRWLPYESGWINQWFYNDPWNPNRRKIIEAGMTIYPTIPFTGDIDIIWGYTTPEWSALGLDRPPIAADFQAGGILAGMPEDFAMIRMINDPIYTGPVPTVPLELPPFFRRVYDQNPEWVLVDIWVEDMPSFRVSGYIHHQCIPEPATIGLLVLGGLVLVGLSRKRTRA